MIRLCVVKIDVTPALDYVKGTIDRYHYWIKAIKPPLGKLTPSVTCEG
jgi:hypothetical protein